MLKFTEMVKLNISNWIPSIFDETGDVRVQSVVDWLLTACNSIDDKDKEIKKYRSALQEIANETIIANTIASMKYMASKALS